MARRLAAALMFVLLAVPAFGIAPKDIYPVSCSDLWDAVKDTLGSGGNYSILAMADSEMTASYVVIGAVRQRVNSVALNPRDTGCELQVQSGYSGYGIDDEGTFRKRVDHSLARLQAAKPSPPAKPEEKK